MMTTPNSASSGAHHVMGALTIDGPQPGWMTLNAARAAAFTGELVFDVQPRVRLYLDDGVVYHAHRDGEPTIGERLVESGLVSAAQLERGTVRIGEIEHLGRLFDRDESIDRDAVIVTIEAATEVITMELANWTVADVEVTAYRHHESGIHRWFAAPTRDVGTMQPIEAPVSLDTIVLPELPTAPVVADGSSVAGAEPWIEWDDTEVTTEVAATPAEAAEITLDDVDIDEPHDATVDDDADAEPTPATPLDDWSSGDDEEDDIDVSWSSDAATDSHRDERAASEIPVIGDEVALVADDDVERAEDGSEVAVDDTDDADAMATHEMAIDAIATDRSTEVVTDESGDPADAEPDRPVVDEQVETAVPTLPERPGDEARADIELEMPPLPAFDREAPTASEIPGDVVSAVRKAIEAIESASMPPPEQAGATDGAVAHMSPPSAEARVGDPFASPPSPATAADIVVPTLPAAGGAGAGDADASADGGDDRQSALRRLISGLRRKN